MQSLPQLAERLKILIHKLNAKLMLSVTSNDILSTLQCTLKGGLTR